MIKLSSWWLCLKHVPWSSMVTCSWCSHEIRCSSPNKRNRGWSTNSAWSTHWIDIFIEELKHYHKKMGWSIHENWFFPLHWGISDVGMTTLPHPMQCQVALVRAMQNAVQDWMGVAGTAGVSTWVCLKGVVTKTSSFHRKSWESAVLKILSQQMLGYCTPHLHVQSIWSNIHIYCTIDCFCQHPILDFVKIVDCASHSDSDMERWKSDMHDPSATISWAFSFRWESTIIIFGHILTTFAFTGDHPCICQHGDSSNKFQHAPLSRKILFAYVDPCAFFLP